MGKFLYKVFLSVCSDPDDEGAEAIVSYDEFLHTALPNVFLFLFGLAAMWFIEVQVLSFLYPYIAK